MPDSVLHQEVGVDPHAKSGGGRQRPFVSVVVPVYNGAPYLRESLDSILGQTYSSTEVLVMDDASTDETPTILADYADHITWHRQASNRGIFGNINDGIKRARGELVAIHHADDVYEPEALAREVRYLEGHSEAGAVFALDIFVDPRGREFGRLDLPRELRTERPLEYRQILNSLLRYENTFIRGGTSLIRSSVYRDVGLFREDLLLRGDLDMWLRIARRYPIGILQEYVVRYRYGHENSSKEYDHLRAEPELSFAIMDAYLAADRELATPEAIRAFEAHRAEDRLMVAVNQYIRDDLRAAGRTLNRIRTGVLLGSSAVQRTRLVALLWGLRLLVRIPRISQVADLFYRRWHRATSAALDS